MCRTEPNPATPAALPLQPRDPPRSSGCSKNTPELPPDFQGHYQPLNLELTKGLSLELALELAQATASAR
jgi:hypothetical protein